MPAQQAEEHQASQEAMAALILPLLRQAWALLDLSNLSVTLPRFREAITAIVNHYGRGSAAVASQHYRAERRAAGVVGRVSVPIVADAPAGFIDQMVAEAVTDALMGDTTSALDSLDSGAEQLVLDQGRRQMMSAVALDREAKGWRRIPNADACSFCLMLALNRYKSSRAASFLAHTRQANGSGGDCRCTAEPDFGNYEPTARVREAQKLWAKSTKGRSGHDARTAFRQAVEGREVTGSKKGRPVKSATKGNGRTPENQRVLLRVLEEMPPATTPEAAKWRTDRIAEIHKYLG